MSQTEDGAKPLSWAQKAGRGPLSLAAFVLFAALALAVGFAGVSVLETRSRDAVNHAFILQGLDWATVRVDGLRVFLTGTAPSEAARARALAVAGGAVDPFRLRDRMEVAPATVLAPPRFSVEILRNDEGIQLIGLLPADPGKDGLAKAAQALVSQGQPADMLEVADYPAPEGWAATLDYAAQALALLPRSKISVSADGVAITAIADSAEQKTALEGQLADAAPKGVPLKLRISAPRPVLTPFTLRFIKDDRGARFDACSADTEVSAARILAAGEAAGADKGASCTVGLGVPSPRWGEAARAAIAAVGSLKAASVTFSDADVTLLAGPGISQAEFDRVVGDLDNALPDVFSLKAKIETDGTAAVSGPAEFTADLLAANGRVELRGRLTNALTQAAVEAFAKARFGADKVYAATRMDDDLPDGWPTRVLTGLAALTELHDGRLVVRADTVIVTGNTGARAARARISQILSDGLGQGQTFSVDVSYQKDLDPLAALPTPAECLNRVNAVQAKQKITFDPGSAEIDGSSAPVLDAIAAALKDCTGLRMEIGGHTDSQGSDGGNKSLSQARAEAVMVALQGRQVDVSAMRAVGYGESRPIADNATEVGRETNRRIEFTLIGAMPAAQRVEPPATEGTSDSAADPAAAASQAGDAATGEGADQPSLAPQKPSKKPKARP